MQKAKKLTIGQVTEMAQAHTMAQAIKKQPGTNMWFFYFSNEQDCSRAAENLAGVGFEVRNQGRKVIMAAYDFMAVTTYTRSMSKFAGY